MGTGTIVVNDTAIGEFRLDDSFEIEVLIPAGSMYGDGQEWRKVFVAELVAELSPSSEGARDSSGLDAAEVLEARLFGFSYASELTDGPGQCLSTPAEWAQTVRKACRALFIRKIPYLVISGYLPPKVHNAPIEILVPDPPLAMNWLTKLQFDRDPIAPFQVSDPETGISVKLSKR